MTKVTNLGSHENQPNEMVWLYININENWGMELSSRALRSPKEACLSPEGRSTSSTQ